MSKNFLHKIHWYISGTLLLVLVSVVLGVYLYSLQQNQLHKVEFPIMGTVGAFSVYGNENELRKAFAIGKAEFDRVNNACSLFNKGSELSRLNAAAGIREFRCSEMMWTLLKRAEKAYIESDGAFDITVKPLMDLWGFYRKHGSMPPSAAEIDKVKKSVGFSKLILNEKNRSIRFSVPGMALDLGGIAKGYAADLAAEALQKNNITTGIVDIGGNLRFLKNPPPGKKYYSVAIRDPFAPGKVLDKKLKTAPGFAVSTSGNYERFVVLGNKRYGHIISPLTGVPSETVSVTVTARTALDADIFSTSACLGGKNIADKLRKLHPESEFYFYE